MKTLGILGGGRFGELIADLAFETADYEKVCFFDDTITPDGVSYFGTFKDVDKFIEDGTVSALAIGVGYKHFEVRERLFEQFVGRVEFATLVHPTSYINRNATISAGTLVFSMCNIETACELGPNVAVFNQTSVTHGVKIGAHSFLSVGVALTGGIDIGKRTFIGVNATVVNDVSIGDDCVVCGGTFLTESIPDQTSVIGNPFKVIEKPYLP